MPEHQDRRKNEAHVFGSGFTMGGGGHACGFRRRGQLGSSLVGLRGWMWVSFVVFNADVLPPESVVWAGLFRT